MNNGVSWVYRVTFSFWRFFGAIVCICIAIGLNGCSKVRQIDLHNNAPAIKKLSSINAAKGAEIAKIAQQYLGAPYAYGGHKPGGFDCSGLVQFSHQRVGVDVPRTASLQFEDAQEVSFTEIQPGDVIFFQMGFWKTSHVGIYVGKVKFIHAPSSGKHVSLARLTNSYWRNRIEKIGRLYR
jgi:cell wall-associated NlpC family hydrolase